MPNLSISMAVNVATSIAQTPTSQVETLWFFVVGQSGAIGKGTKSGMEAAQPGVTDDFPAVVMFDQNSKFTNPPNFVVDGPRPLSPRRYVIDGVQFPADGTGVEISMGRELVARTPHQIRIAKMGYDSSNLKLHWTTDSWPLGGPPLREQLYTFIAQRLASEPGSRIGGMYWDQGESDSAGVEGSEYRARMHLLFDPLRVMYPYPWVLAIKRLPKRYGSPLIVRSGQESYAVEDSLARLVYVDDLPFIDAAHFGSSELLTVGKRVADLFIDQLNGVPLRQPRWLASGFPSEASAAAPLSATLPSFAANDLALHFVAGIGTSAYATPSGFTAVITAGGTGVASRLQVSKKVLTSSDTPHSAVDTPDIGGDDAKTSTVVVFRGANLTASLSAANAVASTTANFPSIACGAKSLVVFVLAHDIDSPTDNQVTFSSSLTQHVDLSTSQGSGSGIAVAEFWCENAQTVSGITATLASPSSVAMAVLVLEAL